MIANLSKLDDNVLIFLRAGCNANSIDGAFDNVRFLSQETSVRTTRENQGEYPVLRVSRNIPLLLHPHIILLLATYTKLLAKTLVPKYI